MLNRFFVVVVVVFSLAVALFLLFFFFGAAWKENRSQKWSVRQRCSKVFLRALSSNCYLLLSLSLSLSLFSYWCDSTQAEGLSLSLSLFVLVVLFFFIFFFRSVFFTFQFPFLLFFFGVEFLFGFCFVLLIHRSSYCRWIEFLVPPWGTRMSWFRSALIGSPSKLALVWRFASYTHHVEFT